MLHTKYQGSMPCGFRQEDFFMFCLYQFYVKHVPPGRGHFWPKGYYLNKLGRGLLGDATYQTGLTLPLAIVAVCYQKGRVATNISNWLKYSLGGSNMTYLLKSVF